MAEKTIRVTRVMVPMSAGRGSGGHQQAGGEGAGGFQRDGERVVVPAEASGEDGEGDEEGGGEHAAAAVQVRVGAIGEGDVERAGGGHDAARRDCRARCRRRARRATPRALRNAIAGASCVRSKRVRVDQKADAKVTPG